MKYTEQAVETLDDAGSVIANRNIEIEQLHEQVDLQVPKMAFTQLKAANDAQAAEIEKLRYSLLDVCTEVESADMLLSHGDTEGALVGVRRAHVAASLGFSLLKRINDSTVILDEVRRAERERVAQFVDDNCTYGDTHILVKAIRAME